MIYLYLGFLMVCALWDIKCKKMPALWLYAGLAWMGIYGIYQIAAAKREWMDLMAALLPGLLCYFLARYTQAMGEGDAWLIWGSAFCFTWKSLLLILFFSFFLAALSAVVILAVKKNGKAYRIPFVPYLLAGTIFIWVGGLV